MSSPLMPSGASGEHERLAGAAQAIAMRLVADPDRRAEQLGEIFLACEQVAHEHPEEFRRALRTGALDTFLLPSVRASLRRERPQSFSGGWLGTYIGADARDIEANQDALGTTNSEALEFSAQAFSRALSIARAEGNETLLRNLRWYRERLSHKSYAAIARAEDKVSATVRTGVARARKFLLRVVHELRHAQPAPLSGEAPAELERLRRLWFEQDLESLARALEQTRSAFEDNPHWLNLAALLATDRGLRSEARRLYKEALIFADAPNVRGRILNNLGNLLDDEGCYAEAQHAWQRANSLVPLAPAPLLNLLAAASQQRDYASAQHHIAQLSDLLNSGRLKEDERAYVCRRLNENPELAWLRDTDVWRQGPARWLSASRGLARTISRRSLVAGAILALVWLLLPSPAQAGGRLYSQPSSRMARVTISRPPVSVTARGGDSMGKPPRRAQTSTRRIGGRARSGDSMGRSGGPISRGRRR